MEGGIGVVFSVFLVAESDVVESNRPGGHFGVLAGEGAVLDVGDLVQDLDDSFEGHGTTLVERKHPSELGQGPGDRQEAEEKGGHVGERQAAFDHHASAAPDDEKDHASNETADEGPGKRHHGGEFIVCVHVGFGRAVEIAFFPVSDAVGLHHAGSGKVFLYARGDGREEFLYDL